MLPARSMSPLTDEELVAALSDSPWERLQAAQPSSFQVDPFHPPRWRLVLDRVIANLELLVWLLETERGSFDARLDALPARTSEPELV